MSLDGQTIAANATRNRVPLFGLYAANMISLFGGNLTFVAIPWFVLQTTGSASKTGLVAIAMTVPAIIVGMFGGLIVDRVGPKPVSIISDILSGVTTALIPLLHHTTGLEFWQLLALVFLGAVFDMPGHTARESLLPDLSALGDVRLERANAAAQTSRRVTQVLGPPAAGVLIAVFGTSNVLWIDAVTFGISALMVAVLIPDIRHRTSAPAETRPSLRQDLLEGLRFVRTDRLVLALMVTFALGSLLAEPVYIIVLPVYTDEILGSALNLGLIYSSLAVGSVLGNIVYGVAGYRLPRRPLLIAGWVVRAATLWIFVAYPGLWTIMALMVLNGLIFEPGNPLFATIMQERVPAALRGRVFGTFSTFASGTLPIGIFAYSLLLDSAGLRTTLVVLAAVNIVPILSLLWPSTWRELGASRTPPLRPEASIAD